MKYPLMLLVGMLVACYEKPKVTPTPTAQDAEVMPKVEFVDPPGNLPKDSTDRITVRVRAGNKATEKWAYAFISGIVSCNAQQYGRWHSFDEFITITKAELGGAGRKTLCAKGRSKDNREQRTPTSHEFGLEVDTQLARPEGETPPDDGDEGDGGGNDDGDEDDGDEDEGHSLNTDDADAPEATPTKKLKLSQGVVKFFSAQKDMKVIDIKNEDKATLTYSLTTEDTAGLLQVRKVDMANKDNAEGEGDWKTAKKRRTAIITDELDGGDTQYLQLRLAHRWKTDYDGDKQIKIKFSDGSDSVELTVHILAPRLKITAADSAITSSERERVWEVNLTPSDSIKTLTVTNEKGDLDVLKWDIFPYRWKPNWFDYGKEEETGKMTVKLKGDCTLWPAADADDQLTLVIASNSDSAGMKARSFALFHYQQKMQWLEEGETELITMKRETEWRTDDIRYVVVKFKNEEGATCP